MLGWRDFNVSDVPVQVLHGRTLRSFLWPSSPEQWSSDTWSVGTDEVRLYPSLRVKLVISTKCRDKQECCLALLTEPLNDNVRLSSIYKCFALCVTVSCRRQPIFYLNLVLNQLNETITLCGWIPSLLYFLWSIWLNFSKFQCAKHEQ